MLGVGFGEGIKRYSWYQKFLRVCFLDFQVFEEFFEFEFCGCDVDEMLFEG